MKNFKPFLALLFLASSSLICMDNSDGWKSKGTVPLKNEDITLELIQEYPDQYEEVNAGVEGFRAFKKTVFSKQGTEKTEFTYHFDGNYTDQAPVTAFAQSYSKSPKGILGWSSTTKILVGSLFFGILFYGITQLRNQKAQAST